jgi:hypothetical protein
MSQNTISLSKQLNLSRKQLEDVGVFDSTLGIDTKLFIDPKLLVKSDIPEFTRSHEKIIAYFRDLLRWHRQSLKSPRLKKRVLTMLAVPEPQGLSIGYGNKTDRGTAIPRTLAVAILQSASELLAIGVDEPDIIEVLPLFVANFGPDRLSDLITNIVHSDLCTYTARISEDLDVETEEFRFSHGAYQLPRHPLLVDAPIIFIPVNMLRPLPVATDWDEIAAAAQHNEELRDDFNKIIFPALQEQISNISEANEKDRTEFKKEFEGLLNVYRAIEVDSYNLSEDPCGYYAIQPFVDGEAAKIPTTKTPTTQSVLLKAVRRLLTQYERAIVDNGGNKLLYKRTDTGALTDKPHHEDVAQIMFYLLADQFCSIADIALARESDAGRGPVDFSLANSYDTKVLVEVKKSTNKSLLDGYNKQVQAYEKSENAFHSFYLVIIVKDRKRNKEGDYTDQLEQVERQHEERKKAKLTSPELIVIDGIVHPSPSNL